MSETRPTYAVTEWHGCYDDSWNGVLVPDAFAHPAKFAPGLISRILRHMLERGYIAPGDSIVDPFGGIAAGGYWAMLLGLHWTGIELEPRFVELGQRNIAKWQHDLRGLGSRLGTARLLQGDSRRLVAVVGGGMGAAVSSPPYSATGVEFTKTGLKQWQPGYSKFDGLNQGPYGAKPEVDLYNEHAYMSPEWLERRKETARQQANISLLPDTAKDPDYPTFWSAARVIVEQTYQVLRPGGYAAWVCKDFVRKGQRVPFSDQWEQLCAAVGFEPVERIAAMLVDDHGSQLDIFGGETPRRTERKSFFRRLAEKKGSPRIDWEDVIIMRKPNRAAHANGHGARSEP